MSSLKWQRFFSGEILKKHVEKHARAVSKSKLRFKGFDEERIKDRKDPFATKVFQTSQWEHRTRVTLEDFSTFSVIRVLEFLCEIQKTKTVPCACIRVTSQTTEGKRARSSATLLVTTLMCVMSQIKH